MKVVRLEAHEIRIALNYGSERHLDDILSGRKNVYGARPDDGPEPDWKGALGEMVLAKDLGLHWNGSLGDLTADDVGVLQVRYTPHDNGCLRMHKRDKDDRIYILVTGRGPEFTIHGYLRGRTAKTFPETDRYRTGRPAIWIEKDKLYDYDTERMKRYVFDQMGYTLIRKGASDEHAA